MNKSKTLYEIKSLWGGRGRGGEKLGGMGQELFVEEKRLHDVVLKTYSFMQNHNDLNIYKTL